MATAAEEAASWLRFTEAGYKRTYGSVPLDKRLGIANAWIDLARIEASTIHSDGSASDDR